jgi:hypothetical protein
LADLAGQKTGWWHFDAAQLILAAFALVEQPVGSPQFDVD